MSKQIIRAITILALSATLLPGVGHAKGPPDDGQADNAVEQAPAKPPTDRAASGSRPAPAPQGKEAIITCLRTLAATHPEPDRILQLIGALQLASIDAVEAPAGDTVAATIARAQEIIRDSSQSHFRCRVLTR